MYMTRNQHTISDRPWADEETLKTHYVEKAKPATQLGEEWGCSHRTVLNWVEKFGLEKHTTRPERPAELNSSEWVYCEYVEKDCSATEISGRLGCTPHTVLKSVREHGLGDHIESNSDKCPTELKDESWVREYYAEKELKIQEIADMLDCHFWTVRKYIHEHGINTRQHAGEHHCWWTGGEGHDRKRYGSSWPGARKVVLERDHHSCRRCGVSNDKHVEDYGIGLTVHHIEPFDPGRPDGPQNQPENLITLCVKCHNRLEGVPIDNRPV